MIPAHPDTRQRILNDQYFGDGAIERTLDAAALFQILRRQAWVILLIIIIGGILASLFVLSRTPIYTASVDIAIQTREKSPLEIDTVLAVLPRDAEAIQGEIELIQSKALAKRVVEKLQLDQNPEFNRTLNPVDPSLLDRLSEFARPLLVQAKQAAYRLLGREEPQVAGEEPFGSQEEVLQDEILDRLLQGLTVSQRGKSYVLEIAYSSTHPRLSAQIANTVAEVYIQDQLESRARAAERANQWIQDRIVELRAQTEAAESAAEEFRWSNGLVRGENSMLVTQEITQLNGELIGAQVRRTHAEARLKKAEAAIGSNNSVRAAEELQSPLIQALQEQRVAAERTLSITRQTYGDRHPEVIRLRAEYTSLTQNIEREVGKIVSSLRSDLDVAVANEISLVQTLERKKIEAGNLSQADVQLRSLTADAQASRQLLNDLQQRYNETKLQRDMQQADARVLSSATIPQEPSSPNIPAIMIIALSSSTILGLITALLREQQDNGFRTSSQLSALTGLPVFGELPIIASGMTGRDRQGGTLARRPGAVFAEAINSIAVTALMAPGSRPRSILVTSTVPDEGKSVFCVSLARTLAHSGMKVLLIDGDLRRPSLHRMMGLADGPGLADFTRDTLDLDSVIQRDPASSVSVMTGGMTTENPLFHLGAPRTRTLLKLCSEYFDLVIIDSPPVEVVSDAKVIARNVDETIYITRWSSTPRETVLSSLRGLIEGGANVSGMVLSRVAMRKPTKYSPEQYGKRPVGVQRQHAG